MLMAQMMKNRTYAIANTTSEDIMHPTIQKPIGRRDGSGVSRVTTSGDWYGFSSMPRFYPPSNEKAA